MEISVLQWNVWYNEDIRHIVQLLHENPADIICLQELTVDFPLSPVSDTSAYVAQELGYYHYSKNLPIESTDGSKLTLANGIFSRFPITAERYTWINEPKSSGGYDDEYRAYIEATLDLGGTTINVATTHMSYTHRFEPTPSKLQETDRLLTQLTRHSKKLIFTGDLNTSPDSETIKKIASVLQSAGPDNKQKTWTTKPFSYNGFEETSLNWRLDYIFTTSDMQVISSEIIPTDFSDHLPVVAKLAIAD